MAAQAETTGGLALSRRLIAFPQCCLSSLSSLQPGTRNTFSQGGDNLTSGLCGMMLVLGLMPDEGEPSLVICVPDLHGCEASPGSFGSQIQKKSKEKTQYMIL